MNYRERMRKAIECPQFGNSTYGEYGALRLDQRKSIKRLLDEMDRADEVIKHQYFELDKYKNIVDELEKFLQEDVCYTSNTKADFISGILEANRLALSKLKELKGE